MGVVLRRDKMVVTLEDFKNKAYGQGCQDAVEWTNTFSDGTFGEYPECPYEEETDEYFYWDDGFWETLEAWGWM